MKFILSVFLLLICTVTFSQKRHIKVNVFPKITAEKFLLSLNSQVESLNNSSVQLIDSAKKVIKTVDFPKPAPWRGMKQYTEVNFSILDLAPGTYTYVIYLGSKEEVCKGTFARDAVNNKIQRYCDSLYKAGIFNGNILVADKGKIIYKASFGKANEQTKQDLNENSIFELASVSKQFTAMAAIILKEKGKLSLDDTLSKFIPELSFCKTVTIRNLLNHTSGLPDYMALMDTTFDKSKIATNVDVISSFVKYKPKINFKPNTKYEYSNTGYALLASVIEKVSGQTYADFLRDNIFKPLGMKNSFVYCRRKSPKDLSNYAYGYIYMPHLKRNILPDSIADMKVVFWLDGVVGDGCVNSTTIDLLIWDRALYSDKLCSKESLKDIFSSTVLSDKTKSDYGFGWEILENDLYKKIVCHDGQWPGYSTFIDRHIENDKTIIVLQNVDRIDGPRISVSRLRGLLYADK